MRILLNALATTNLSGRHVLLGHLSRLARWTAGRHEWVVLWHPPQDGRCPDYGNQVKWVSAPPSAAHWIGRYRYERRALPRLVAEMKCDLLFSLSGMIVPTVARPQATLAMNPWCLVKGMARTPAERLKAFLQRREYRRAMRSAATIVFASEFMRRAYRENAGFAERRSVVAPIGLDDETHAAAESLAGAVARKPGQVVCVSAMARHKGVETIIEAMALLPGGPGSAVRLLLIGAWPDPAYERRTRALAAQRGLADRIEFKGHVSRKELYRHYAESKVFCLMSRCESFGIPAVEAQAFGTPVVSSNCCAIPEVCGAGGVYPEVGDAAGTARALGRLLQDDDAWRQMSHAAVENAARYRWDICSRPLLRMLQADGEAQA